MQPVREHRFLKSGCFGVQVPDDDAEIEAFCQEAAQGYSGQFKDDVTGQVLKDKLVQEARRIELDFFNKKGGWTKVPYEEARNRSGRPPITVR